MTIARNALITSALVTAASIPRQLLRGPSAGPFVVSLLIELLLLTLVADAPFSWGSRAGMAGAVPERERLGRPLLYALGLAALLVPLHLATDPALGQALLAQGRTDLHALLFPPTLGATLAAMLWVGGMETLFFYGFVVSLLVRAFDRPALAIAAAVLFRTALSISRLSEADVLPESGPSLVAGALTSLAAAWLFTRGGLPATALLLVLVKARHLVA